MTRELKTAALVMGSHKLGDADRVVTLFTGSDGRIPVVVKGVRKVTSRFGGRLEPLTLLTVSLHPGRNLYTLTGADTVSTGSPIRDDPYALKAGLSFIELLSRTTAEHESRPRTWNLVLNLHPLLAAAAGRDDFGAAARTVTLAAELKLLLLAGFLPHLDSCASCGADEVGLSRFSAAVGGSLCPECPGDSFAIAATTLASMREMLERPLAETLSLELPVRESSETWQCVREICRHHLGADLKIQPWL